MLRAIRFAAVLGFNITQETLSAIISERERLSLLATERVNQEISKMLLAEKPSIGIKLLVETGLINYILPELIPSIDLEFDPKEHKDIYAHILQVLDNTPPKLELRWLALLHDIAKPLTRKKIGGEYHFLGHEVVGAKMAKQILKRLKYPNSFAERVSKLTYLHQRIPNDDGNWTDGAVRRLVRDAGDLLEDLFIFAEADSTGKNEHKLNQYRQKREVLKERIAKLEREAEIAKIKSPLSGDELMKIFKRQPGPWIKPIKEELLRMVLDNELAPDDKKRATEVAREILRKAENNY
jgi:poly(A) polymerase